MTISNVWLLPQPLSIQSAEMWACFSYNNMSPGVQWTALWYRGNELVHYETLPWDGTTGGLGYSEWAPPPDMWQAGTYEVQVFVGQEWKVVGQFIVSGDPPTLNTQPHDRSPTISPVLRPLRRSPAKPPLVH